MNRSPIRLLFALLLAVPVQVLALASDREQPIRISADRVELNEQTGVSTYQGDVSVVQGSLSMEAAQVVVYQRAGQLERIEAKGDPAHFRQLQEGTPSEVRGSAQQIEYRAGSGTAYLIGNGHLWRGRDEFEGDHIEYETRTNVVKASGGSESRVHAVIHPKTPEAKP